MTERSSILIQSLRDQTESSDEGNIDISACCRWLHEATLEEVDDVLNAILAIAQAPESRALPPLAPVFSGFVQRQLRTPDKISDETRSKLVWLYGTMEDSRSERWRLLQWLASSATAADLDAFADMLIDGPPADWQTAAAAFAPLFQRREYDISALFPHVLEALKHVAVAAPILDLANYLTRRSVVKEHPASSRSDQLTRLLGDVTGQLGRLEERPPDIEASTKDPRQQIEDSVALLTSLCDALALIGDRRAIGKLRLAMELGHRRVRTEAASALARFGDEDGTQVLIEMAAEPVVRLRVLADAEELGIAQKINPEYVTNEARAEAHVALELAQAAYFGIPPQRLEPIDSRILYWPGFDEPQDCHLIRYVYRSDDAKYSNIAIAGPIVHTFVADLNDVPIDDIYAAYAGWHVDHEEIFEVSEESWTPVQRQEADRLVGRLNDTGYCHIRPVVLSFFFGDISLVATAVYDGAIGTVIVDQHAIEWQSIRNPNHPVGPTEALCIFKGRRLLKSFN